MLTLTTCTHNLPTEDDHLLCDPTNPQGCQRCFVPAPTICCDLEPGSLSILLALYPPTAIDKPQPARRISRLKPYKHDAQDMQLHDILDGWRVEQTVLEYGRGGMDDFGPGVVMTDEVLERIEDCAHHAKIHTVDDLQRECKWSGALEYGTALLKLLHSVRPIPEERPLLSTQPLAPRQPPLPSAVGTGGGTATTTRSVRCSACGKAGHNRKWTN